MTATRFIAAWCLVAVSAACTHRRLTVAPEVVAAAPAELLDRVRADPYNYFRLINHEWTARVCEAVAAGLPGQPVVQLHGDAHLGQFALMKDAWGLDDFDDSARGPALIDIIRFLGSIDLAARGRGWLRNRDRLFTRFFEGYRRGLADPAYRPPEPDIVRWKKTDTPAMTHDAFMAWAETKMRPMSQPALHGVSDGMKVFTDLVRLEHPGLSADYFHVVRAGWLRMGVGSAESVKVLIRAEGPSNDPSDDVLLEAKVVRARGPLACLEESERPTFHIVHGSQQVGRLKHDILVAGPERAVTEVTMQGRHLREWWIRSWDPTYREVSVADLRSVDDLFDIVYDAGVQLGAGVQEQVETVDATLLRTQLLATLSRSETRLRSTATRLVQESLRGWHDLGGRSVDVGGGSR